MQGDKCVVASGTEQALISPDKFLGYLNADVTAVGSRDIFAAFEVTRIATSSVFFEVIFVPGQDASTAVGAGGALGRSLFGISPKPGGKFSGMRFASSTRVLSLDVSYPQTGGASALTETFSYNILTAANGRISAVPESMPHVSGVTSP
jgi:hypothetical protein